MHRKKAKKGLFTARRERRYRGSSLTFTIGFVGDKTAMARFTKPFQAHETLVWSEAIQQAINSLAAPYGVKMTGNRISFKLKRVPNSHYRRCQFCGREFIAKRSTAEFCPAPATCRREARKARPGFKTARRVYMRAYMKKKRRDAEADPRHPIQSSYRKPARAPRDLGT